MSYKENREESMKILIMEHNKIYRSIHSHRIQQSHIIFNFLLDFYRKEQATYHLSSWHASSWYISFIRKYIYIYPHYTIVLDRNTECTSVTVVRGLGDRVEPQKPGGYT